MGNIEINCDVNKTNQQANVSNRFLDDVTNIWTLLCDGVREQMEKWPRGETRYFVEDNMDFT